MIGTKGSGKSSTGNSILGEPKFKAFVGTKQGTDNIKKEKTQYGDTEITVIDTPGVREPEDLKKIMEKLDVPETTVYAIVIPIGRFNELEKQILEEIRTKYDVILPKSIIIFTRRNELNTYEDENERTIDKWLESVETLSSFIRDNNLEIRVLENKDKDPMTQSTQAKDVIDLCKAIIQSHVENDNKGNISNITVGREEMKRAFGDKGVEFFEEKIKCKDKKS